MYPHRVFWWGNSPLVNPSQNEVNTLLGNISVPIKRNHGHTLKNTKISVNKSYHNIPKMRKRVKQRESQPTERQQENSGRESAQIFQNKFHRGVVGGGL